MMRAFLVSLRPAQWIKNGFVAVAPLFAKRIQEPDVALTTAAAMGLFSLAASGIYLLNDVADRKRDRLHPEKRRRPVAAGDLGVGAAVLGAVILLIGSAAGAFLLAPSFGAIIVGYVLIQIAYSLKLRQVVLVDVFCITSGFVLRVFAGGFVTGVPISSWLVLTTIFVSLFLALCKRRAEIGSLAGEGDDHRATLADYDVEFLDQLISVTTASVVICYSLYTLDARTVTEFGTKNLVFTVPFVIYGIFRYLFLVHCREGGESPATALFRDASLAVNTLMWLVTTAVILYG